MISEHRGRRSGGRGQALTEFALVVPFFLLVIYGIIEFGRYVYTVEVLNNAAREGARYAIVHGAEAGTSSGPMLGTEVSDDPPGENVKDAVRKYAVGVLDTITFPAQTCPSVPSNPCWVTSNQRGDSVTVVAQTTFTTLIPFPLLPGITVEGSSTLVVNH
jgi:hypothetical protein